MGHRVRRRGMWRYCWVSENSWRNNMYDRGCTTRLQHERVTTAELQKQVCSCKPGMPAGRQA
jgi:hypothetical protein